MPWAAGLSLPLGLEPSRLGGHLRRGGSISRRSRRKPICADVCQYPLAALGGAVLCPDLKLETAIIRQKSAWSLGATVDVFAGRGQKLRYRGPGDRVAI